jgi:hypothetical protein
MWQKVDSMAIGQAMKDVINKKTKVRAVECDFGI